jgi:hypothetical protein
MHFLTLVAPSDPLTPAFTGEEDAQVWWSDCLVAPLRPLSTVAGAASGRRTGGRRGRGWKWWPRVESWLLPGQSVEICLFVEVGQRLLQLRIIRHDLAFKGPTSCRVIGRDVAVERPTRPRVIGAFRVHIAARRRVVEMSLAGGRP